MGIAKSSLAAAPHPCYRRLMATRSAYMVHYKDKLFADSEDVVFNAASIAKLHILDAYINDPDGAGADWDTYIRINDDHRCTGSGVLLNLEDSIEHLSAKNAAELMISLSDNTASNMMISTFSDKAQYSTRCLNEVLRNLGYSKTGFGAWYGGKHRDPSGKSQIDQRCFSFDAAATTTAREALTVAERLFDNPTAKAMMEHSQDRRGLFKDGAAPDGCVVGHKTGYVDGVRHDVGWWRPTDGAEPVFAAFLTDSDSFTGADGWSVIDSMVASLASAVSEG